MYPETKTLNPFASEASGIRCMKAPPNNPPTERLTKYRRKFFFLLVSNFRVIIPTRDNKLKIATLNKE
jgi:hypothetical protein